jgi:hypothetical protein
MIAKAQLIEISAFGTSAEATPASGGVSLSLDFNPETLKVSLANNNRGGGQPAGGSGKQYVAKGTSNLSVEFVFDTSADDSDVRVKTAKVAHFLAPNKDATDAKARRVPPRCRFQWGSFIFEGVVESMDETLDYFSEDGKPLRATVSIKLARDEIVFFPPAEADPDRPSRGAAGQVPLATARPGASVRDVAAGAGLAPAWKAVAAANGIDDPLRLRAGAKLDLGAGFRAQAAGFAGAAVRAGAGAGAGAQATAGAGAGAAGGAAAGAKAGFSAGLGGGAGFGASASAGAGAGASAGAGAGAGAGASAGFGAGAGASAGASAGFGAGAGASAGVGAGGSAGASAGFGAGASAGAGFGAGAGVGVKAGTGVNAGIGASAGASTKTTF